jgi:hypothetical protein
MPKLPFQVIRRNDGNPGAKERNAQGHPKVLRHTRLATTTDVDTRVGNQTVDAYQSR